MADQDNKLFDTAQNKPTTIDDLVKQLSNQNSSKPPLSSQPNPGQASSMGGNQPPPNLPGIKVDPERSREGSQRASASYGVENKPEPSQAQPQPSFNRPQISVAPSLIRPPLSSQIPQPPPIGGSAKPVIPPIPPKPVAPAQEYKSSIRTMGEDISSIKSGQKPAGVYIPRTISPEQPKIGPMLSTPAPLTGPLKPPTGPVAQVGLGKPERSSPIPSLPTAPKGPTTAPIVPKPSTAQPSIVVPGVKRGPLGSFSLGRTTYMLVAGIVVVGGFLYWFLVLRTEAPGVITYPTPSPTTAPTPVVENLDSIFDDTAVNFQIVPGGNMGGDFKTFVSTLSVSSEAFVKIDLAEELEGALVPISFLDMFDVAPVTYPAELRSNITDSVLLAYGQSESFNADGTINLHVPDLRKTVLVAKVKDGTVVEAIMKDWELSIADDLSDYLLIPDIAKEASINFLDNAYGSTSIRYKNFPSPDTSIDYSLVNSRGQNYLVISSSRQSMYAAIDVLTK